MMTRKSDAPAPPLTGNYWTIAVLVLVVVGVFAALAAADRAERYAAAERERAGIVGIAHQLADNAADRYRRLLTRLADETRGGLDVTAEDLLRTAPALDPDLQDLAVLAADGTIIARFPGRAASATLDTIAGEATAHVHGPELYVTTAVRDPGLGIDLVGLARARFGVDGKPGGAIIAVVGAASLVPLDRLPPLPGGSRLTLFGRNGAVLFRSAVSGAPPLGRTRVEASGSGLQSLTVRYEAAPGEIAAAWRAAWLRNGAAVGTIGLVVALAAAWLDRRRKLAAGRAAEQRASEAAKLQQNVAELAAAKSRADAESRAKSLFFAQVTHELRTPLNAILGFSEAIKRQMFGPITNSRYVDYGGLIHDAGSHLLSLINDLLDLSKLEEGRLEIAPIRVSAAALARATFDLVELLARERNLTLVLSGVEGCRDLHVDPRAAKQVLVNLLSNAIKFTPPGGRIDVRFASRGDGAVVITVADSGVGMSPEELRLAFEPFGRARGEVSERTPGTGLGLPIARALMRLHGGDLTLTSRPGAGTSATAVFPAEATVGTMRTLAVLSPAEAA